MTQEKIDFAREECIVPESNELGLPVSEAIKLLPNLDDGWSINQPGHLERVLLTKNFKDSLYFATILGNVAEKVNHHPDLFVAYGKLRIEIWTHKIGGLSRADFVLAAKFDKAIREANYGRF